MSSELSIFFIDVCVFNDRIKCFVALLKKKSIYFEILKTFILLEKVKKNLKVYSLRTNQRELFFFQRDSSIFVKTMESKSNSLPHNHDHRMVWLKEETT